MKLVNSLIINKGLLITAFSIGVISEKVINWVYNKIEYSKYQKAQNEKIADILEKHEKRKASETKKAVEDYQKLSDSEKQELIENAMKEDGVGRVLEILGDDVDPRIAEKFNVQFEFSKALQEHVERGEVMYVPVCEMTFDLPYFDLHPDRIDLGTIKYLAKICERFIPDDWLDRDPIDQNAFLQYNLTVIPYDEIGMELYKFTLAYRKLFGIDVGMRDGLSFGVTIAHPDTISKEAQADMDVTLGLETPKPTNDIPDKPFRSFMEEPYKDPSRMTDTTTWDLPPKDGIIYLRNHQKDPAMVFEIRERDICEDFEPQGWDSEDWSYRGQRYTQMMSTDGYYDEVGNEYIETEFYFGKEMISHMYYPVNPNLPIIGTVIDDRGVEHPYDEFVVDRDACTPDGMTIERTVYFRSRQPICDISKVLPYRADPYEINRFDYEQPYGAFDKEVIECYEDMTVMVSSSTPDVMMTEEEKKQLTGFAWGENGPDEYGCFYMRCEELKIDVCLHDNGLMTFGESLDWHPMNRVAERLGGYDELLHSAPNPDIIGRTMNRAQRREFERQNRRKGGR